MSRPASPRKLAFPAIRLEPVRDEDRGGPGFLTLRSSRYRAHFEDGSTSAEFRYDELCRSALDAVVIAAHFVERGERHVVLRSALRPPVARRTARSPSEERERAGALWELPAGLVEVAEVGAAGPRASAKRELAEETGYEVSLDDLQPLGPSTFPAPGFIAERHYFFEVEVAPDACGAPALDGSALEHGGIVVAIPLECALAMCRDGAIEDAKTELGLRRLAERFS